MVTTIGPTTVVTTEPTVITVVDGPSIAVTWGRCACGDGVHSQARVSHDHVVPSNGDTGQISCSWGRPVVVWSQVVATPTTVAHTAARAAARAVWPVVATVVRPTVETATVNPMVATSGRKIIYSEAVSC
jgi:hypothetical protein